MRGLSFSYDEKLVVTMSDAGGRPDLWVEPIGGGPATQITHVEGFVHSYAFSPAADVLAYEADKGGDELPHLFLTNSKGDSPKDIVADMPAGRRTQLIEWADDGKTLLYLANGRDEKQLDLYEYDLAGKRSKLLWKSEGAMGFATLASHDHKRILVVETKSDENNDLYLVDLAKPADKKIITTHTGDTLFPQRRLHRRRAYGPSSPATRRASSRRSSRSISRAGNMEKIIEHEENWDVEWSADVRGGKYRPRPRTPTAHRCSPSSR